MTSLRQERVAKVLRRVAGAERTFTSRHPGYADAVRHSLGRLRDGLERAHDRCEEVDDRTWAGYVADLDRGLGELDVEISRAAERRTDVVDVLAIHASALELAGWRLRFALGGPAERIGAAEAELERYRAATAAGHERSASALERSIDGVRAAQPA